MRSSKPRFPRLGWALRESFREGYAWSHFVSDLRAGLVVGIVAIPLAMALAIASGSRPENGLYTIVTAGFIVALLGGSRHQVTGPTAAFVVLLLPIVQKYGISGLFLAGMMSGVLLLLMGIFRLGESIRFVPHPVITGFTSGIGVVIGVLQLPDFFGLEVSLNDGHFLDRCIEISRSMMSIQGTEAAVGVFTLFVLLFCVRYLKKSPAPFIAIMTATLFFQWFQAWFPSFHYDTVGARFASGIPKGLPSFQWPWDFTIIENVSFSWSLVTELFPTALSISVLAAVESLLSATVAEGSTKKRFAPNSELMALGLGNFIGPFFGGLPATGAIARTTTNIRFGARSPIAACVHAVLVALVLIYLAPLASYLPMASLAAVLLFVAYNMLERRHFLRIMKKGEWEDRTTLLVCFLLTIVFDMTIGVTVGMILAALLFIRRISRQTEVRLKRNFFENSNQPSEKVHPDAVFMYEINGPMFFGAAHRAVEAILQVSSDVKIVILSLDRSNLMDMTAEVALESAITSLREKGKKVFLVTSSTSLQEKCREWLDGDAVSLFSNENDALQRATLLIGD